MIDENFLTQTYWNVRQCPGWLPGVSKSLRLSLEEVWYLEWLDEIYHYMDKPKLEPNPEGRRYWKRVQDNSEPINKWENRIKKELRWGIDDGMAPKEKIRILSENIADCVIDSEKQAMERERNRVQAGVYHRGSRTQTKDFHHKIERAKSVPLERFLGTGRVPCPFHQGEDNNFLVNGDWGYCFVCGESADAIKYHMRVNGKSFKEAVEFLGG